MLLKFAFALMQIKLLELQDLVMRLVKERNEWYSKYVAAAQSPELLASQNEKALPVERRIELNATDGEGKLETEEVISNGITQGLCAWMGGVTCLLCLLCALQGYEK